MTRNTKLYKAKIEDYGEVLYRTLNVREISFLNNIKNAGRRNEMAAKIAITEGYSEKIHFTALNQIGTEILNRSTDCIYDKDLLNITIDNLRMVSQDDMCLFLIMNIIRILPNASLEYLMEQTYEDLIELTCLCEQLTGKKILNVQQKFTTPNTVADPFNGIENDNFTQDGNVVDLRGVKHVVPPTIKKDGKTYLHEQDELSLEEKMKQDQKWFKEKE